ncbi:hypothetical protein NP493_553g02032 [Ridgeia piscesae]|uniref:Uncharacterized protein n=1 Tax=Ridgeia piscesae TaxID=27915 RepID=A0AAD9KVK3_RIDPI|nr:hypothetical protein NP493_553g02032 [Ridgeia piscesae]
MLCDLLGEDRLSSSLVGRWFLVGPFLAGECLHNQAGNYLKMDVGETLERRRKVVNEPLENRKRALDGGWGWMCLFGCTLIQFLIGFYGRSYGLIYLHATPQTLQQQRRPDGVGGRRIPGP